MKKETTKPPNQQGMLSISIRDQEVLYSSYMSFLKNGGLFIPIRKEYALGDEVFLLLSLMEEPERIALAGTVVWKTPANAENNRAQGIGVHFNDKDNPARPVIEKYLAGRLGSNRLTHTL